MDYNESVRWLWTLPDFERTGDFAERPDLAPMRALLAELGDPHLGRPTVHIAGSKGKGSTGVMIEAVLRAAGTRTGYYISPHLHRYNERIRIDASPATQEAFASAMSAVRDVIDRVTLAYPDRQFLAFDALTATAFVAFREAAVEVQVIEVGLGGRLDSTNVFQRDSPNADAAPPHVVVLTAISLEHTAILGDTIAAIAIEKAGIITEGATVVVAPQRESALDVFRETASRRGATLIEVASSCQLARTTANADGQQFKLRTPRTTYTATLPLAGRHQLDNAATAVLACEQFAALAGIELTPRHVSTGLAAVSWPGRLEVLTRKPLVIIDGAHNGDSAKRMVAALREHFGLARATFLFGTLADKDVAAMADAVAPMADAVFVSGWSSPRAANPHDLAAAFRPHDVPVSAFGTVAAAYEAAAAHAGERGALVAFGSLAFVAAVREHVLGIESDNLRLAASDPA
jgi:dihydrofolate synthase/folylpolyglutamate synthase